MAKVSLRIYNREIESFIDQGHIDEAIAHCHQILKTFSKHLATYRLLGKAYLELKRYNEAVDVFGRVLMSVPDDFVSHVGMSIINDEENKLDDAIWHMERAFESQPSNAAIQGELQRLYGRRDGMEPPKIRMTRGALAHMYVQGELYPQAIAEIRAVLFEDPDRADMQVLLARANFRGGQKADASDMCAQLLKRYTYCFDANRIMVDLLPDTAGAIESTQVYRMRVGELDPYATFAKGSVFQSDEVADAAINLERLEYKGEEAPTRQEWSSSLGLGNGVPALAAASSSNEPDWLKTDGFSDPFAASQTPENNSQDASQSNNEIPNFLRDAGWGESNAPEQPTSFFDEEPASGGLTPAEIPDWLKGQVPSDMAQPATPQPEPAQSIETPDWLLTSKSDSAQPGNVPDWLSRLETPQPSATEPAQATNVPDWLSGLETPQPSATEPAQATNVPDWLSGLDTPQPSATEPAQPGDVPDWLSGLDTPQSATAEPVQATESPDWLSGLGTPQSSTSEPAQAGDIPDWLSGLDTPQSSATEPTQPGDVSDDWLSGLETPQSSTSEPAQAGNVPDWLSGLDTPQSSASESAQASDVPDWLNGLDTPQSSATEPTQPDDVPDWLSGLDTPQSSASESAQAGDVPDWLNDLDAENQKPPQPAATIESLGSTAQEQDDAVAWLESLAAKHGAKPEELVTDPSKRFEKPPEWVSQAQNLNQQEAALQTPAATIESLGSTAQEQDDAVAWLESLAAKHGAKPEELVTDPSKRFEKPPEWVSQAQSIGEAQSASALEAEKSSQQPEMVENALNIGEQYFAEFETASTTAPAMDETSVWLRSLDEEETQAQTSNASKDAPDQSGDSQSEPEQLEGQNLQRAEIPEWLSDTRQSQNSGNQFKFAEQESDAQNSDIPSWLSDIEKDDALENTLANQEVPENDLSDWLNGLDDEPGLPFDGVPTPDAILFSSKSAEQKQEPVAAKSDLPDWLNDVDSRNVESEDEWKTSVQEEPADPVSQQPNEMTAPVSQAKDDLPDWLQNVDEEEPAMVDEDDTPPWLHREKWEAGESQTPTPTSPSDWHPIEPKQPESTPAPKQEIPVEARKPFLPPPPQPVPTQPVEAAPLPSTPAEIPAKKKSGLSARKQQPEAPNVVVALNQAKGELDRGDIPAALAHYTKLIKKGKHLEETIRDLTESIYRYPVEVGIWQTLGDAYMRANRLKEALEAYNKAEELIR